MKWETVKLEDVCLKIISGGTPLTSKKSYYYPPQIPWLKTAEVNYCRIWKTENMISEEGLNNSSAKLIPENSVIVAMYGQGDTAGRVAINKIPLATNQACCNLIINPNIADYRYVYYILSVMYEHLIVLKSGGAQPNLNAKLIKNFEIKIPELKVQKTISDVLSAYDDLIENNQKQIKLLEEAAQRLYKEWFVDLHFPGYENTPVVDGIPEGWIQDRAENFFKITIGKTPPRIENQWFTNNDNGLPWLSISDMGSNNIFVSKTSENLTLDAIKQYNVNVVHKDTIFVSFKLTVGRVAIATTDMCTNEAIAHFHIDDISQREYVYSYLKQFHYETLGNTSSISKAVNSKIIKAMPFILPSNTIISKFNKQTKHIFELIKIKATLIYELKTNRDILLSKLLSEVLENNVPINTNFERTINNN